MRVVFMKEKMEVYFRRRRNLLWRSRMAYVGRGERFM
jgi:hypothetical protein